MCCTSRGAHLSLISRRSRFDGFHMDLNSPRWTLEKMKRCPKPYLREDLLQQEEIPSEGNAVRDTVPERNKRVEISSLALAYHVNEHAYVITARQFGAIAFHCICQVVQHAISSLVDAKESPL